MKLMEISTVLESGTPYMESGIRGLENESIKRREKFVEIQKYRFFRQFL